jgi:hypothetical protein
MSTSKRRLPACLAREDRSIPFVTGLFDAAESCHPCNGIAVDGIEKPEPLFADVLDDDDPGPLAGTAASSTGWLSRVERSRADPKRPSDCRLLIPPIPTSCNQE